MEIDPRLRKQMLALVAELDPEDGQPPPRHTSRSETKNHADARLCAEVFRVLTLVLEDPETGPPGGAQLLDVTPAPDAARLRVRVVLPGGADALNWLQARRGHLRSEVAAAIRRKRAPDLVFVPGAAEGEP
jgi:hypothetical protein